MALFTGLGDYVHYNKINYLRYGINRPGEGLQHSVTATSAATTAYNELKQNIVQKAMLKTSVPTKDIENFYNNILLQNYGALKDAGQITEETYNRIKEQYEADLAQAVYDETGKHLERSTLSVSAVKGGQPNSRYRGVTTEGGRSRGNGKRQGAIQVRTATQIRDNMHKLIESMPQPDNLDPKSMSELQIKMQRVYDYLNQELTQLGSENFLRDSRKLLNFTKIISYNGESISLLEILQLYNEVMASFGIPSKVDIGTAGEFFGAFAAFVGDKTLDKETNNLIKNMKKSVIGKQGSITTLTNISPLIDKQNLVSAFGSSSWEIRDGVIATIKESQDTVDCSINYETDNNIFGAQQVNISFKNYFDLMKRWLDKKGNLIVQEGIGVLSGAPLESILQLVNTNLGNHYLNLLAEAGTGGDDIDRANYFYKYTSDVTAFNEISTVIKYAVAVRAITGARTNIIDNNTKLSNYLIVNLRKYKQIKVYSTEEIFSALDNQFHNIGLSTGSFNNNYFLVEGLPGIGSLKNVWNTAGPFARITSILGQLSKFKLSASITPAFFEKELL